MGDAEVDRYGRVREPRVGRSTGVRDNSEGTITPQDIERFNQQQARQRQQRQEAQGSKVVQDLIMAELGLGEAHNG